MAYKDAYRFVIYLTLMTFVSVEISTAIVCTTNRGLEYILRRHHRQDHYHINACCPCRAPFRNQQLPLCSFTSLLTKLRSAQSLIENHSVNYESTIQPLESSECLPETNILIQSNENMTETLLQSYQTLVKISLKIHIITTHENRRLETLPPDTGDILCHIKAILGNIDMTQATYQQNITINKLTRNDMMTFTCKGLRESVQTLGRLKTVIQNKLLEAVNSFA